MEGDCRCGAQGSIAAAVVVIIVLIAACALATFFLARMRARRRAQVPVYKSRALQRLVLMCMRAHKNSMVLMLVPRRTCG